MASGDMRLSAQEKAAVLIISLGREYASKIYKHLTEDEIEQLTLNIASIQRVDSELKDSIVEEFSEIVAAQKYISEGGIEYAREVMEEALGMDKANTLISKLTASLQVRPFEYVRKADTRQILNLIQNEHPQIIALILSYLNPKQAAEIVATLDSEDQADIIERIATMGAASPEYVREVERIVERKLTSMGMEDHTVAGGIDKIVQILTAVDRSTEKGILEKLEVYNNDLADDIRSKMFVFEDIVKLTNQAIQRVLKEVESKTLALALKNSSPDIQDVVFVNISRRMQDMIKEDMEYMGPVRVRDVEEAQQNIVNVIRRLDEAGEITISRGEEDAMLV